MGLVTSGPEMELGNHSMRSLMVYFPMNQETAFSCLRPIWKLNMLNLENLSSLHPYGCKCLLCFRYCPGLLGYLRGVLGKASLFPLSEKPRGSRGEKE